jgi:hypothetical protein
MVGMSGDGGYSMQTSEELEILVADRIWVAMALLHQQYPLRNDFKKAEILDKLEEEGLTDGVERGTLNAHLDQHCVANVRPSSGKYRMLFETSPGNLRLYRPGDLPHPERMQKRKPSKSVPAEEKLPTKYKPLLSWYESWIGAAQLGAMQVNYEDDPLIRLIGSGRHIWADEHADEYVENLRREDL